MIRRSQILYRTIVAFSCFALLGCEYTPKMADLASANPDLVNASSDESFDWPVAAGLWQVSRPTSITALRKLEPGKLGKRYAEIQAQREQRIKSAQSADSSPPWMVESLGLEASDAIWLKEVVQEIDNELQEEFSVVFPRQVLKHNLESGTELEVRLDFSGRRLAVLNDSIWLCRLPWREKEYPPDAPPQDSDEPGNLDDFRQVGLSNATPNVPVLAEFYGDQAMMIAVKGRNLYTIDCDKIAIVAETDIGNPVIHLDVAFETGDAIIVDSVGKIHLFNAGLKEVVNIGTCDLELPMPVISPEAARVALYDTKEKGRVYKIQDLVVLEQFDVPLTDAGEPLAIRAGRRYDLWIEKNAVHKRPNYPNEPGTDRKTSRASIYWDVQDVIDWHELPSEHSQLVIAKRPMIDEGGEAQQQWVACDAVLGNRNFFAALPLPDLTGKQLATSGHGWRVCLASADRATLYHRILKYTNGAMGIYDYARFRSWDQKTDSLEKAAALISRLPEDRHDRRPQQLYSQLVTGISGCWQTAYMRKNNEELSAEDRSQAREVIANLEEWLKKKSTLAICSAMFYHSGIAWNARGHGYSGSVSSDGWKTFEKENARAMKLWEELAKREYVPACAFAQFVELARDTSLGYDDVNDELSRAMELYPIEDDFHHEMMFWLLEKWGGNRGSSSAYAAAVASAVGGDRGDFMYSRLIQRVAPNYQAGFLEYAQVDRGRVLRGIRHGIRTGYWQQQSTIDAMSLLGKSMSGPGASRDQTYVRKAKLLCQELADYYQTRYPMLDSSGTTTGNLPMVKNYLPE